MKCVQCGVISAVEESLGRHLKAAHFATEMRDICGEVSIFVAFIGVALVNVPLSWAGEFIKVDLLIVLINDHNVWLFCSHTDLRRNGTTSWCRVPRQITVYCVLFIDRVHNIIDHTVVPPSVATTLQSHLSNTQNMVCGLSTFAKFAQV